MTKREVMREEGLLPLLALVENVNDGETSKAGLYALGTLCEVDEVKAKLVEVGVGEGGFFLASRHAHAWRDSEALRRRRPNVGVGVVAVAVVV